MPALQTLVLTDRATPTPVAHTFVPVGMSNGVVTLAKSMDGTLVNERKLTLSHKRANGKVKTREVLYVPEVQTETINGVSYPKIVNEAWVDCTFTFTNRSSEQFRKDVVGMFQSGLEPAKVMINDMIVKQEGAY